MLCNKFIKFNAFLKYATKLGASLIAMGHYARCQKSQKDFQLLKGIDPQKDQSYFLHRLDQHQLSKSLFPLGDLHKDQVREYAAQLAFPNSNKKDSTGICFIGERKFKTFLQTFLPAQPGEIQSVEGEVIGRHDGLMYYTIGQRQGLGIGGLAHKSEEPWYVVEKMKANVLWVAQGEHPALYANTLTAADVHWINESPSFPLHCSAKIRYRQQDQDCVVSSLDHNFYQVQFSTAQRAISPGQSVVFYQGEQCLGGGVIQ